MTPQPKRLERVHTPTHVEGNTAEPLNDYLARFMRTNGAFTENEQAYIIRAVNAFDSMKVALEAVKRGTEPYDGYIMTMVNQAIARAEGVKS